MKKNNPKVLVIGGPTGVGESTITKAVIKAHPNFRRLVTATTRKPRLSEKEGLDYYFFSEDKFKEEIKKGNIIEYTYVDKRNVYYGSYKPDLDEKIEAGYDIIINPDLIGAKYYKKNYKAITIFIAPESLEDLHKRLLTRDPNIDKKELEKRLAGAKDEIDNEADFYDYRVINKEGELDKAIEEVLEIVNKEN